MGAVGCSHLLLTETGICALYIEEDTAQNAAAGVATVLMPLQK